MWLHGELLPVLAEQEITRQLMENMIKQDRPIDIVDTSCVIHRKPATAFVEAVDSGSFSAAARRLRKSQSTISTAIANLEADLGVILLTGQRGNDADPGAGADYVKAICRQRWL